MGTLRRFNLRQIREQCGVSRLVETGTGRGDSLDWALACGFDPAISIEQDPALFEHCTNRFCNNPRVTLYQGLSHELLARLDDSADPAVFFLDAHFIGGADFGLVSHGDSCRAEESFPLIQELEVLTSRLHASAIIVIDDARMYLDGDYQNGSCPEFANRHGDRSRLEHLIASMKSHQAIGFRQDDGYIVLVPKQWAEAAASWVNILPTDHVPLKSLELGVPGITSISMSRRLADHRYASRYFCGAGIDVGGGRDPLAAFHEFLPLCKNVVSYDLEQGNGQTLANVPDNSFDFLYSSHCLEHLSNPAEALENWIRVVHRGGHLIISIPDEDLYEQGVWPSRFNQDHKSTFTIMKPRSWSPASINLLPMLMRLSGTIEVLMLQVMDQGNRWRTFPAGTDQTRSTLAESSIEMVFRKR